MKKRIIGLILVAVMAVLALSGCAYSYTSDDMSQYADFDKEAFAAALKTLVIEDADFGTDEEKRQEKVLDAIFTTLSGQADADEKLTEGTPNKYSLAYYCYYCTMDVDGEEIILFASNMKESGATKLQLGVSSLEGLNKDIADKLASVDFKDYAYKTSTSDEVEAGDIVFVSYVREYEQQVLDKDGNPTFNDKGEEVVETVKETVTNKQVNIPDGDGASFLHKLVGIKAGASATNFDITEEFDEVEKTVKYSSVKVNWIVDGAYTEVGSFKDVTYDAKKEVKDIFEKTYDLKDKELTYHVFPVYYLAVPEELTAEIVIDDLLGDDITVDTLDCFKEEKYKNGEETLEDIIKELATLQADLATETKEHEDAETAYDKAKKAVDDAGDKATNAQKTALSNAEKELKDAKAAEEAAQKKVDDQIAKVWGCGEDIKDVIVKEYKEYRYEGLEDSYKSAIKNDLAVEIYKLARKYTTFKYDGYSPILPKKAVNEAYDRLVNNYKYDFYEGKYTDSSSSSSSSSSITNYKKYDGDFNAFLKIAVGLKSTSTMQEVYDAIGKEAEESVQELIIVYTLAEYYGEAVKVTEEDKDEFKKSFQYILLVYQVGEENVNESDFIHALQLDNVLNYLLEEKEDYEGNTVQYERVEYTFKAEDDKK